MTGRIAGKCLCRLALMLAGVYPAVVSLAAEVLPGQVDTPVIIIVDATDNMWIEIDAVDRIEIVRDALSAVVAAQPDDRQVGLVSYSGPERVCTDTAILVRPGPVDEPALTSSIRSLAPGGRPAPAGAVATAIETFATAGSVPVFVLIASAADLCEGDLWNAVDASLAQGRQFVLHVIAPEAARDGEALSAAALAGNGTFQTFNDVQGLTDAVLAVFETSIPVPDPQQPGQAEEKTPVIDRVTARETPLPNTPGWTAKPCECAPDFLFQSYGLFEPKTNDGEPQEQPVRFGSFSRIGYSAMLPRVEGSLLVNQPDAGAFVELPHRYHSKVDLVVSIHWQQSENGPAPNVVDLSDPSVRRNITNDVAWMIRHYGFDGVTLRISASTRDRAGTDFNRWRLDLVERLNYRLAQDSPALALNLIIDYTELNPGNPEPTDDPSCDEWSAGFQPNAAPGRRILRLLSETVDYILVDRLDENGRATGLQCPDVIFLKNEMTGFVKRNMIIPILANDAALEPRDFADLYDEESNFAGIGINDVGAGGAAVEYAEQVYRLTPDNTEGIKALQLYLFPDFCNFVCPHRDAIRLAYGGVLLVFALVWGASIIVVRLRTAVSYWVFLAVGVGLLLIPYVYALCVPEYRDDSFWIGLIAVALIFGYFVRGRLRWKKVSRVIG